MTEIAIYAAFAATPDGGNPAGVVLDAAGWSEERMQQVAHRVGASETAFVTALDGDRATVRYFAPEAEVPFCGHATVAAAVALADRDGAGRTVFATRAGDVEVVTASGTDGRPVATFTSRPPVVTQAPDALVDGVLATLGWTRAELDPRYPLSVADAGAAHLVLVAGTRERLAGLTYDFDALRSVMTDAGLVTLQLVHPRADGDVDARDPFPVGGVVEDPATGAAAAALGGYLRHHDLLDGRATFTIWQGQDMGRPSRIEVTVPAEGGVVVTGGATRTGVLAD